MLRPLLASLVVIASSVSLVACAATTTGSGPRHDGGPLDSAVPQDSSRTDAGRLDASNADLGWGDGATTDMPVADLGPSDSGSIDLGPVDAGAPDLGPPDLGPPDLGPPDLGPPDLGPLDLGPPDMGLCANVFANPAAASDMDLWDCALAAQLQGCHVNDARLCGGCACDAYVTADSICSGGSCSAPINGTGCSDHSFYSGAPFSCSGTLFPQTACMLRYLILNGYCD